MDSRKNTRPLAAIRAATPPEASGYPSVPGEEKDHIKEVGEMYRRRELRHGPIPGSVEKEECGSFHQVF